MGGVDNTGFEKFRSQTKFMVARWGRVVDCCIADRNTI
jgi:hypothetical protein